MFYLMIWGIIAVTPAGDPLYAWKNQGTFNVMSACEGAARDMGIPKAIRNRRDGNPEGQAYRCVRNPGGKND